MVSPQERVSSGSSLATCSGVSTKGVAGVTAVAAAGGVHASAGASVSDWQQQQQQHAAALIQQQQQQHAVTLMQQQMQQQVQQAYGCGGALCGSVQCSVPAGGCAANMAR